MLFELDTLGSPKHYLTTVLQATLLKILHAVKSLVKGKKIVINPKTVMDKKKQDDIKL